jgi:hypothetical protein
MKKIIISVLTLLSILLAISASFCWSNPVVIKYFLGRARVLKKVPAIVKENGREIKNAYCFLQETSFDGKLADILVLWLPNKSSYFGRDIIMIDRKNVHAGIPNASNRGYGLLGDFLLQSENAQWYVSFSSLKAGNQDPKLEIKKDLISFVYSDYTSKKKKKIEIAIKQKNEDNKQQIFSKKQN